MPTFLGFKCSSVAEGLALVPVISLFYSFVSVKVIYTTKDCFPATRIAAMSNEDRFGKKI